MGSIIIAATVGFLLGILLMIFLVAGREEENLLDQVEKTESFEPTPFWEPDGTKEAALTTHPQEKPSRGS